MEKPTNEEKVAVLKVWDNAGETIDRYTIRINNDYFAMSECPNVFNQYVGSVRDGSIVEGKHLGKQLINARGLNQRSLDLLPKAVQLAIIGRIED